MQAAAQQQTRSRCEALSFFILETGPRLEGDDLGKSHSHAPTVLVAGNVVKSKPAWQQFAAFFSFCFSIIFFKTPGSQGFPFIEQRKERSGESYVPSTDNVNYFISPPGPPTENLCMCSVYGC